MIIERFCYSPFATLGKLVVGDTVLYTVEPPWQDNTASKSCIPEGEYSLEPHSSKRFPDTWALVGETVSHYPQGGKQRSVILFHIGNTPKDTYGCICPGTQLWEKGYAVISSKSAMQRLREELKSTPMYIRGSRKVVISHFEI